MLPCNVFRIWVFRHTLIYKYRYYIIDFFNLVINDCFVICFLRNLVPVKIIKQTSQPHGLTNELCAPGSFTVPQKPSLSGSRGLLDGSVFQSGMTVSLSKSRVWHRIPVNSRNGRHEFFVHIITLEKASPLTLEMSKGTFKYRVSRVQTETGVWIPGREMLMTCRSLTFDILSLERKSLQS